MYIHFSTQGGYIVFGCGSHVVVHPDFTTANIMRSQIIRTDSDNEINDYIKYVTSIYIFTTIFRYPLFNLLFRSGLGLKLPLASGYTTCAHITYNGLLHFKSFENVFDQLNVVFDTAQLACWSKNWKQIQDGHDGTKALLPIIHNLYTTRNLLEISSIKYNVL